MNNLPRKFPPGRIIEERQAEINEQAMLLMEKLTPEGSEFHNNPEMCFNYLKEKLAKGQKAIFELIDLKRKTGS